MKIPLSVSICQIKIRVDILPSTETSASRGSSPSPRDILNPSSVHWDSDEYGWLVFYRPLDSVMRIHSQR